MLNIKNLNIKINEKQILKNINILINTGETVCIIGKNGNGKSTLLKTIMGHYSTEITSGEIYYNNKLINSLGVDEKVNLGIYLANQNPIEIQGINQLEIYKAILNKNTNLKTLELFRKIDKNLKKVGLPNEILERYLNDGFSGGEKKKNEIMMMELLNPELIMLDEIDSGLDATALDSILKILKEEQNKKTIIYITHQMKIIKELTPDKIIILGNETIIKSGGKELVEEVLANGLAIILKKYKSIPTVKKRIILESCGNKIEK